MLDVHTMLNAMFWTLDEKVMIIHQCQRDIRDIPYHMVSCSSVKSGVKSGRGRDVWSDGICLPLFVMSPAFLEVTEHLPADGK